jgi:hypothetical protein
MFYEGWQLKNPLKNEKIFIQLFLILSSRRKRRVAS